MVKIFGKSWDRLLNSKSLLVVKTKFKRNKVVSRNFVHFWKYWYWWWVSSSYRYITGAPEDNVTEIIVTPEIVAIPLTYKTLVGITW